MCVTSDCLVLFSPICTSFCWAFTVTVSINTFLIRHGVTEVRPIHLHPFICLCSNGNKCVSGINTCIFLKLASEQFVPNGNVFTGKKSSYQRPDWILQLCEGESRAFIREQNKHWMCVHSFIELRDTFPMLFIISTYCRNLVTLQPHPKHPVDAEEDVC